MKCVKTQGFYDNATSVYKANGMTSHGGDDISCGYGTPIENPIRQRIYKILDAEHPANDGSGYWGIFGIAEFEGKTYEICVGHCSRIDVKVGDLVEPGQILGLEGNHGQVFVGQTEITKAMQDAGDKRGSHRHWQARSVKKNKTYNGSVPRLIAFPYTIFKDDEGYYYEIPDYYNGVHGLSPVIDDILKQYENWKLSKAVVDNIESVTEAVVNSPIKPAEKQGFLAQIASLLKAFSDWLNKKN